MAGSLMIQEPVFVDYFYYLHALQLLAWTQPKNHTCLLA